MPLLEGVTVIELYPSVAVSMTGRYLSDLGASVTIVEPRGGLEMRASPPFGPAGESLLFAYLQHGKRSLAADLAIARDRRRVQRELDRSALVLHGWTSGRLEAATGWSSRDSVALSITPFGETGPRAGEDAAELTMAAASGLLSLTRCPDGPPTLHYGHQPSYFAALGGVVLALSALLDPARQRRLAISVQETLGAVLEDAVVQASYAGNLDRLPGQLAGLYPTLDAAIAICINIEPQWESLCIAIGREEWRDDARFASWSLRVGSRLLDERLQEWARDRSTEEAFEVLQELRIPAAKLLRPADILEEPQARERALLQPVRLASGALVQVPGLPFGAEPPQRTSGAPPAIGAGSRRSPRKAIALGPPGSAPGLDLSGVRVLDFTHVWAGPFCTLQIADLGADVIRVESAIRPDQVRLGKPVKKRTKARFKGDLVLFFQQYNRNKRSISLEVSHPEGRDLFLRLIGASDVVVDNFSARVMPQLGLDFADLAAVNPRIVQVRLTGYGLTGPLANAVAYGESLEAATGLTYLTRSAGHPVRSGIAYPDVVGGYHGAIAILAGLLYRERTGRGIQVDVSERDGTIRLAGEAVAEASLSGDNWIQESSEHPAWSPCGVYPCRSRRWVTLVCKSDGEWAALARLIGLTELAGLTEPARRQRRAEIGHAIATWTKRLSRGDAVRALRSVGVEAEAVLVPAELLEDEHLRQSGFMARVTHPLLGDVVFPGPPATRDGRRLPVRHAPLFGQDTDDVLRELLGLSDCEIERFAEAGAVKRVLAIDW